MAFVNHQRVQSRRRFTFNTVGGDTHTVNPGDLGTLNRLQNDVSALVSWDRDPKRVDVSVPLKNLQDPDYESE